MTNDAGLALCRDILKIKQKIKRNTPAWEVLDSVLAQLNEEYYHRIQSTKEYVK